MRAPAAAWNVRLELLLPMADGFRPQPRPPRVPQVYTTLAVCVLVCAAGVYADAAFHLGGTLSSLAAFAALV